ncbi:MAG: outer membrane protein assembly factor BamD [Tepidisphaerales bacterium]
MRKMPVFAITAGLAIAAAAIAQPKDDKAATAPPPAWELKPGGQSWQQVNAPTTQAAPDDTLDRVEEMLQSKQSDAAHKLCLAWIHAHKEHPLRDRAVFLLGIANFMNGDRIEAYYDFDEVMDTYPDSRFFYAALEQQYIIADQFLKGYKRRFLGMAILDCTSEATEMLYRIQQRAPGSPLAEKSLLRVADYFYSQSDFDLSFDAYAAYVRGYPKSPHVPRVRMRMAFSSLAQFRGIRFDATPIIDARQQLLDIARLYPDLAEKENVASIISRIDESLGRKLLDTAAFYKRTHQPASSAYYYRYVIKQYPDSPEAKIAAEQLSKLPPEALQAPEPPVTRPATLPSGPADQEKP